MTIPAPTIQWPTRLREKGPPRDPTILFVGEAVIADIRFTITALRVRADRHGPDFRENIPEDEYDASLETMMEGVEDLVGSIRPCAVLINHDHYILWMVPDPNPGL